MNETELIEISEFIYLLADSAKKITMTGFNSSHQVIGKEDGSPVTQYDINAEKIIIDLIKEKFPNHNIIAEENESQNNASDYTWIIDPIDGTRSYIIGRPLWGTLIGLAFKGKPIIGLADFPALDQRWLGYGKRCYLNKNDFESRVSTHNNLSQATVASTSPSLFSDLGKQKYKKILLNTKYHIWSGDCHNYMLLINGNLDLVVEEGLALYDIIPLVPILETQGIKITDWQGSELSLASNKEGSVSVLASNNKNIYESALSILR
jgi:inositol-phosphate phosphatase / L-galactose 1-phosphate phosphatase / histidinol-phosphatase